MSSGTKLITKHKEMGEGEETKSKQETDWKILGRGLTFASEAGAEASDETCAVDNEEAPQTMR